MRATRLIPAIAAVFLFTASDSFARIKLTTLPKRERVEIQLDNGRYTLVEEERIVPLLRGDNRVDFSWSNTHVDKDSIQLRPIAIRRGGKFQPIQVIDGQPEVVLIHVAYPPNENALVWSVYAARACALKMRVSYLISNLGRTFSYRALANKKETELTLKHYINVRNYSGEDFGEAGVWAGFGPRFRKLVGQQTDIKMLVRRFHKVPVEKTFTFDWYQHGPLNPDKPFASRVLMHYRLRNTKRAHLGEFPLQPGKVRIFIQDGHGGEAFLGEDWAGLTPIDGDMRLFLGEARDIVCTRKIKRNKRHKVRGNLFDQELLITYEIENFKDSVATIDIRERINRLAQQYGTNPRGFAEWELGPETTDDLRMTYEDGRVLPKLHISLPARPKDPDAKVEKTIIQFHITIKNLW